MKPKRIRNEDRPVIHKYAEVWLNEAVELLRPGFADAGFEIPPVHLSVGFSTDGYKPAAKKNTIAVCHAKCMTVDGINEIFISPIVYEPVNVLSLLVHELIHAIDDCKSGHGEGFLKISYALKCADNPSVSVLEFREKVQQYRAIADQLGRYPRSGVNYTNTFDFRQAAH
ncbi:hypothetical protein [Limnohabitans sp.]